MNWHACDTETCLFIFSSSIHFHCKELLQVRSMCGICCISMRSTIIVDLIATFILPATLLYYGYLCFNAIFLGELPPLMLMVTIGITLLSHILIFLIRKRWDYWFWLLIYMLGVIPVFYFISPRTRQVCDNNICDNNTRRGRQPFQFMSSRYCVSGR